MKKSITTFAALMICFAGFGCDRGKTTQVQVPDTDTNVVETQDQAQKATRDAKETKDVADKPVVAPAALDTTEIPDVESYASAVTKADNPYLAFIPADSSVVLASTGLYALPKDHVIHRKIKELMPAFLSSKIFRSILDETDRDAKDSQLVKDVFSFYASLLSKPEELGLNLHHFQYAGYLSADAFVVWFDVEDVAKFNESTTFFTSKMKTVKFGKSDWLHHSSKFGKKSQLGVAVRVDGNKAVVVMADNAKMKKILPSVITPAKKAVSSEKLMTSVSDKTAQQLYVDTAQIIAQINNRQSFLNFIAENDSPDAVNPACAFETMVPYITMTTDASYSADKFYYKTRIAAPITFGPFATLDKITNEVSQLAKRQNGIAAYLSLKLSEVHKIKDGLMNYKAPKKCPEIQDEIAELTEFFVNLSNADEKGGFGGLRSITAHVATFDPDTVFESRIPSFALAALSDDSETTLRTITGLSEEFSIFKVDPDNIQEHLIIPSAPSSKISLFIPKNGIFVSNNGENPKNVASLSTIEPSHIAMLRFSGDGLAKISAYTLVMGHMGNNALMETLYGVMDYMTLGVNFEKGVLTYTADMLINGEKLDKITPESLQKGLDALYGHSDMPDAYEDMAEPAFDD